MDFSCASLPTPWYVPACRLQVHSLEPLFKVPEGIWRHGDSTVPVKDRIGTQGTILQPPREMIFPAKICLHAPGAQPAAWGSTGLRCHLVPYAQGTCTGSTAQPPRCWNLSWLGASQHPDLHLSVNSQISFLQDRATRGWFKEQLTSTLLSHLQFPFVDLQLHLFPFKNYNALKAKTLGVKQRA